METLATVEVLATEEECSAGQLVTSGPQEVMVTKVEETSVTVTLAAALTAAKIAAKEATVENCIAKDEVG